MKKYPSIRYPNEKDAEGVFREGDIIIQEKLDGCLPYGQRVQTEDGAMEIGKIVNNELDVKVKSINTETNKVEYKPIDNYWKNGKANKWLKIEFDDVRSNSVTFTPNHEVYTQSGKVQVADLTKRHRLVSEHPELTEQAKDMLIGSLLGDASVQNYSKEKNSLISETHGKRQHEYVDFKIEILGELISNTRKYMSKYNETHEKTEKKEYCTKSIKSVNELCNKFIENGEKIVPDSIEITDRVLAILFCDDGSTTFSNKQRPTSSIHTQGFKRSDVQKLFDKIDIDGRIADYGNGYRIEFTSDGTEKLFQRIQRYVPSCMSYKISDHFWTVTNNWEPENLPRDSLKITNISETERHNNQKYDIEVADNHNYFTKNILSSNSNFRFTHERNLDEEYQTPERNIVFGSRNVIYKNRRDEAKQFAEPIDYVRGRVNPETIEKLESEYGGQLTFFGEAMMPHTLEYDWKNTPWFVGFDVYHEDDERWLTQTNIERVFDALNLPITPVIDIVSAEAWDDYSIEVGESAFGDVKAEGFTFKNYETQTFAKFVRDGFKEKNKKTFGASKKQQKSGAEKLSYTYITNARIEKQAHKLVDEGDYDSLKMQMMKDLPTAVIRDMAEEEAGNIFMDENFEVDLSDFRSLTSSRCAEVLKQMVQKRAIEEMS